MDIEILNANCEHQAANPDLLTRIMASLDDESDEDGLNTNMPEHNSERETHMDEKSNRPEHTEDHTNTQKAEHERNQDELELDQLLSQLNHGSHQDDIHLKILTIIDKSTNKRQGADFEESASKRLHRPDPITEHYRQVHGDKRASPK